MHAKTTNKDIITIGAHPKNSPCPLLGLPAESRVINGEGWIADDAEEGGISLFGGGLSREEVVEDDAVAILGIWIHMDNRQGGTLATKHVQTVDGIQSCLGHSYGTVLKRNDQGALITLLWRLLKCNFNNQGGGGGGGVQKGGILLPLRNGLFENHYLRLTLPPPFNQKHFAPILK